MRLAHVSDLHLGLNGAVGDPKDVALKRMLVALAIFAILAAVPLFELHYLMGGRN